MTFKNAKCQYPLKFFLFIHFERESCYFTYLCIQWLLLVCFLTRIQLAILVYQDNALINWATWPGQVTTLKNNVINNIFRLSGINWHYYKAFFREIWFSLQTTLGCFFFVTKTGPAACHCESWHRGWCKGKWFISRCWPPGRRGSHVTKPISTSQWRQRLL